VFFSIVPEVKTVLSGRPGIRCAVTGRQLFRLGNAEDDKRMAAGVNSSFEETIFHKSYHTQAGIPNQRSLSDGIFSIHSYFPDAVSQQ
jgi:hypothetical protein